MPITERTLRRWRGEALRSKSAVDARTSESIQVNLKSLLTMNERILRLTQELMDQHLLRKETK